jgi:hypothetical protein
MKQTLSIASLTLIAIILYGCVTGSGARQLSGRYVNPETGGVIVFRPDGKFYYAFAASTKELPGNVGRYWFEHAGDAVPTLSVRSAHAGQFSIRVSDRGDRIFVINPALIAAAQAYEKQ